MHYSFSKTYNFEVEMTCEGCANAVKRVLSKLGSDVSSVHTDVDKNTVTVTSTLPEKTILETLLKTSKPVNVIH
ncbi:Metal homeostasi factor ATX1 [Taenia solium]|eukprot:TsM_000179400 transcript=TsM_000179400 gene=TsM_000179400